MQPKLGQGHGKGTQYYKSTQLVDHSSDALRSKIQAGTLKYSGFVCVWNPIYTALIKYAFIIGQVRNEIQFIAVPTISVY